MSIELTREGGLAILTIDRPRRRNALAMEQWRALGEHSLSLAEDPTLRAVVLHGSGGHFCAGMDLNPDNPLLAEVGQAIFQKDRQVALDVIRELKANVAAIAALPVPVIAAIEGACAGGGLEVALCADMRVA